MQSITGINASLPLGSGGNPALQALMNSNKNLQSFCSMGGMNGFINLQNIALGVKILE
jgi:hypothetical protein